MGIRRPRERWKNLFRPAVPVGRFSQVGPALLLFGFVFLAGLSYFEYEDRKMAEIERLRRAGLDEFAAAAVVDKELGTLRSLEEPLPPTGIYASRLGAPEDDWAPLKIFNHPDSHAFLKLIRANDQAEVMRIFVRQDEKIEIYLPLGSYKILIARGKNWYGDKIRFGPDTDYAQFDKTFNFVIDGDQISGFELFLTPIESGNLRKAEIASDKF